MRNIAVCGEMYVFNWCRRCCDHKNLHCAVNSALMFIFIIWDLALSHFAISTSRAVFIFFDYPHADSENRTAFSERIAQPTKSSPHNGTQNGMQSSHLRFCTVSERTMSAVN